MITLPQPVYAPPPRFDIEAQAQKPVKTTTTNANKTTTEKQQGLQGRGFMGGLMNCTGQFFSALGAGCGQMLKTWCKGVFKFIGYFVTGLWYCQVQFWQTLSPIACKGYCLGSKKKMEEPFSKPKPKPKTNQTPFQKATEELRKDLGQQNPLQPAYWTTQQSLIAVQQKLATEAATLWDPRNVKNGGYQMVEYYTSVSLGIRKQIDFLAWLSNKMGEMRENAELMERGEPAGGQRSWFKWL